MLINTSVCYIKVSDQNSDLNNYKENECRVGATPHIDIMGSRRTWNYHYIPICILMSACTRNKGPLEKE